MATLAQVARERKNQLRSLSQASLRLDAKQEILEREVKRLQTRKKGIPELADAERLTSMLLAVDSELGNLTQLLSSLASSWSTI